MKERPVPLVSVVIPNWNGLKHFPECVEALRAQTYREFEVIVSDNDSSDGSVEWLEQHAPEVTVVRRSNNDGFAAAVNDGIRVAKGEYVYLLNNDTHAEPACIEELVNALERSEYDFAASLMVFYDHPDLVNTAGDVFSMEELCGMQRGARQPVEQYREPQRVLGASGGAAMYRREFFDVVGLYDENFFVLHEDTDINLRALIAGMRCLYVPTSVVRHKVGASVGRRGSPEVDRQWLRNRYLVIAKDIPGRLLPGILAEWAWTNFRTYVPLRPDRWHRLPTTLRAFHAKYVVQREGFRLGWSKRRDAWSRRKVPTREIIRWLNEGTGPV